MNLIYRLVVVGTVLAWLAASVSAADIASVAKAAKNTDDKAKLQRKARAALALAATTPVSVKASFAAPMPRAKDRCECGEACKCEPGKCPLDCAKPATVDAKAVPKAAAVPVSQPVYTLIGYDRNGQPVYSLCANGTCSTGR